MKELSKVVSSDGKNLMKMRLYEGHVGFWTLGHWSNAISQAKLFSKRLCERITLNQIGWERQRRYLFFGDFRSIWNSVYLT